MILENQAKSSMSPSSLTQKSDFSTVQNSPSELSQFSRIKSEYHQKVRIRQLQKIKSQKRKRQQTHIEIEKILQSDFPKESSDVKYWASQLIDLYKESKKYQTDAHKIREIFLVAERFPCLGTLRLFHLAILTTSPQNIRPLFEMDVWKFLHNILKHPGDKRKQQSPVKSEKLSISPCSISTNINEDEICLVKAALETFVSLYQKDIAFRDYSIRSHLTFSNYVKPVIRIYGDHIKTEVIYFLMAVLNEAPKEYSKEYISIIRLTVGMVLEYKESLSSFFVNGEWIEQNMKESIHQTIVRISTLLGVLNKLFGYASTMWLHKYLFGQNPDIPFNYFEVINQCTSFAQCVLNQLVANKQTTPKFHEIFEKSIELTHNSIMFFMLVSQKTCQYHPQDGHLVKEIMGKIVWTLDFLQSCDEKKLLIYAQRELLVDIEKTKQISLFAIDNALLSEFAPYDQFAKNFIFYMAKDGKRINFLDGLCYLINTAHHQTLLSQIFRVVFTLLRIEIPNEEVCRFSKLVEIVEKIIHMLADIIVAGDIKMNISEHLVTYINERSKESIGYILGIERILLINISAIQSCLYNQSCGSQLFNNLQIVLKCLQKPLKQ